MTAVHGRSPGHTGTGSNNLQSDAFGGLFPANFIIELCHDNVLQREGAEQSNAKAEIKFQSKKQEESQSTNFEAKLMETQSPKWRTTVGGMLGNIIRTGTSKYRTSNWNQITNQC